MLEKTSWSFVQRQYTHVIWSSPKAEKLVQRSGMKLQCPYCWTTTFGKKADRNNIGACLDILPRTPFFTEASMHHTCSPKMRPRCRMSAFSTSYTAAPSKTSDSNPSALVRKSEGPNMVTRLLMCILFLSECWITRLKKSNRYCRST